jgi:hypothetical protein
MTKNDGLERCGQIGNQSIDCSGETDLCETRQVINQSSPTLFPLQPNTWAQWKFSARRKRVESFNDFLRDNARTPDEQEVLAAKLVIRWPWRPPLTLAPSVMIRRSVKTAAQQQVHRAYRSKSSQTLSSYLKLVANLWTEFSAHNR